MRVLVCGSREWEDEAAIVAHLEGLAPGTEVIHGGARGADTSAGCIAAGLGLPVRVFPADWAKHGKRAGFLRNLRMLDERPDLVIAFQSNGSRGTQHTVDEARRRGVRTVVVTPDGLRSDGLFAATQDQCASTSKSDGSEPSSPPAPQSGETGA